MQKLLTLLLAALALVATLPHAEAVKCYSCVGYDPVLPEHHMYNNKYCPAVNFNSAHVGTATGNGTMCMTLVKKYDVVEITTRSVSTMTMHEATNEKDAKNIQFIDFNGYFCNFDYCNEDYAFVASAVPATSALCLPLLLLSLLTAVHQSMA